MTEISARPFVSVIVPTYHDWERLQLCLIALDKQTYPKNNFEIIVVNNNPSDPVPEHLMIPDNCILAEEEKPGSYAARNKGISLARGDIFAFTDSDCKPDKSWLSSAVELFLSNENISRIGGHISFEKSNASSLAFNYERVFGLDQKLYVTRKHAAVTANMIARSVVFDNVGGFNGVLKSGGDMEWGIRSYNHGYKIYYSKDCCVTHPSRNLIEILNKSKRAMGGHYDIARGKGFFHIFLLFLTMLVPPVFSIGRTFKRKDLDIVDKAKVSFLRIVVRFASLMELLLLIFGKKSRRA